MHNCYKEFKAENNYELGRQMGAAFKAEAQGAVKTLKQDPSCGLKIERSKPYLEFTQKHFPQYIEELEGYAESAEIDFQNLWILSLEDELSFCPSDKCSSAITNQGRLVLHNEDWEAGLENIISVVKKTIGTLTILELYYQNTLGGNSFSINSNGFTCTVNSLSHSDWQPGLPHNVIARWLSETADPEADFKKLENLPRATGSNHIFVNRDGKIWNMECSAKKQILTTPSSPFAHTNHYLSEELKKFETKTKADHTFYRYAKLLTSLHPNMSPDELESLGCDKSEGPILSVLNERTVAQAILDTAAKTIKIRLKRENNAGWVDYRTKNLH